MPEWLCSVSAVSIATIILAIGAVLIPTLGLLQRLQANKGIGWQFIRFTVISTALPIGSALALNNALTGEAATILGSAMAYAFGHGENKSTSEKSDTVG